MIQRIKKELSQNGYSILKSFYSKEIILETLKSYEMNIDYCIKLKKKNIKGNLDEKYLALEKMDKKLKSRSYDISKFHSSLSRMAVNKKILKIIEKLHNEVFFVDYPQIRADDIKNSYLLPLHQEIYGQLSSKVITLWCPLTNVSKFNGTLNVIPGSHKFGKIKHQFFKIKNNKYHGADKEFIKNKKIKSLKLNSGDIVLFDPHLLHGSGKNISNKIRWSYIVRYNAISGIKYLKDDKSPLRIVQKFNS